MNSPMIGAARACAFLFCIIAGFTSAACEETTPAGPIDGTSIQLTPSNITISDTLETGEPAAQNVVITSSDTTGDEASGLDVGTIEYSSGAGEWLTAELSATSTPATLRLTARKEGLAAGTYSATVPISAEGAGAEEMTFTLTVMAAPVGGGDPDTTITIIAAGNAGCGSANAVASAAVIAAADPDYVLMLGDNVPRPAGGALTTLDDYMNCFNPAFGQFKSITYATLGDNEVDITATAPYGSGTAPGADAYFGAARVGPAGKNYYSFNVGDWHLIGLNVQTPGGPLRPVPIQYMANTAQLNWLINDLANDDHRCTLAFWYQSMWISSATDDTASAEPYPNRGYRVQDVRGIWTALYEGDADLAINGWPFIYERFAPMRYAEGYQNPTPSEFAADPERGIRQITTGLLGSGPMTAPAAVITHPLSQYRRGGNGVLKLVLGDGWYEWEFLNAAGSNVQDSGRGTCH